MSIFKSTFAPHVKTQLARRQQAMVKRTPQDLSYINSRNAWIRISSSVNVNGTNDLAKKYVLQGGTLNNITDQSITGSLKSGIGSDFSNAYSNTGRNGQKYRLGIRPMPGITSIDIKSKSAYGSLREVTVNFQCWDINQLEDLELLYMRPGYTMLIEWGWVPYFKPDDPKKETPEFSYESNFIDYYDIINKPPTNRTVLFKELYEKSVKHGGNYDAMFGYVKNYQWSARMDGGYDCQVSVISTGEIMESLKVNYTKVEQVTSKEGVLYEEFSDQGNDFDKWGNGYDENILAGIWKETWYKLLNGTIPDNSIFKNKNTIVTNLKFTNPNAGTAGNNNSLIDNSGGGIPFITLEAMCDVLNKYVIAKSINANNQSEPLMKLSVYSSEYDLLPGQKVEPLYCIAHPLQVSVDPSICLIKSPVWSGGEVINTVKESSQTPQNIQDQKTAQAAFEAIKKGWEGNLPFSGTNNAELIRGIKLITNISIFNRVEELIKSSGDKDYHNLQDVLKGELTGFLIGIGQAPTADTIAEHLNTLKPNIQVTVNKAPSLEEIDYIIPGKNDKYLLPQDSIYTAKQYDEIQQKIKNDYENLPLTNADLRTKIIKEVQVYSNDVKSITISNNTNGQDIVAAQYDIEKSTGEALKNVSFLNSLTSPYFYGGDAFSEIGIIGNIYVNVDFLYQQALSTGLQSTDQKGKNEISLFTYVKNIMNAIQASIGNINDFGIHIDPVDNNIARIIDVKYTEPVKVSYDDAKKLYPLPIHNLESTVRSYSLQSKIFPEQSALIAIGSQAKGGQLGIQSNTMIDFNMNLIDRIIPEKVDAQSSKIALTNNQYTITNGFANIIVLFDAIDGSVNGGDTTNYASIAAEAKNSLKDLITYFQTAADSPGSNRNLIPTKFSAEMDGIGGLVIGHMFKLPETVLPRGYRGVDGIGSKLANAITSINHSIQNNDWVTSIDALNIVIDNLNSPKLAKLNLNIIKKILQLTLIPINSSNVIPLNTTALKNKGDVDKAMKFFLNKGFSNAAAAAAVGSFLQESTLNPKVINFNSSLSINAPEQTYAAGIAQWIGYGGRRSKMLKYARSKGINIPNYNEAYATYSEWNQAGVSSRSKQADTKSIIESAFSNMTLDVQLEFVEKEMRENYSRSGIGFEAFKKSTNLNETVLWMYVSYEGGNYSPGAAFGSRERYAVDLFNRANNGEFGGGPVKAGGGAFDQLNP